MDGKPPAAVGTTAGILVSDRLCKGYVQSQLTLQPDATGLTQLALRGDPLLAAAIERLFAIAGSRSFQSVITKSELGNEANQHYRVVWQREQKSDRPLRSDRLQNSTANTPSGDGDDHRDDGHDRDDHGYEYDGSAPEPLPKRDSPPKLSQRATLQFADLPNLLPFAEIQDGHSHKPSAHR